MPGRLAARHCALAFLVATIIMTSGDSVSTCVCFTMPVCGLDSREPAEGSVVFIGTAVDTAYPLTRFTVERVLVGPPAAELTLGPRALRVADGEPRITSSCDLGFSVNKRYLVYARTQPETGDLLTSQCSRTRLASVSQALADIAYFDARAAGRSTVGWLSGAVQEQHYDSSRGPDGYVREWVVRPLSGIRVTATSSDGAIRSTTTNEYGGYFFEGLTPSRNVRWRIKADLPAPFAAHDGTVRSPGNGPGDVVQWLRNATCAEADVDARVDGRIVGRVLDERGRPARGVVMELANATALATDEAASADEKTVSDDDGRFEFRPLPEGRYYVGVELDKRGYEGTLDRRRYYPGVRNLKEAIVIELRRGERLRLEPFRLPLLPEARTLTVVLKAPSPEIAAQASVFMTGAAKERLDLRSGSVTLRLPYGATFDLRVQPPQGYFVNTEQAPFRGNTAVVGLMPDQTDRTITFTLQPIRR